MNAKRYRFLIGGIIILGAVAYLVLTGMKDTVVYYYTVGELKAKSGSLNEEGVRVAGKVVQGSIKRDPSLQGVDFIISDENNETMPVTYKGIVPDIFGEGIDVVVEGRYKPEGVFHADNLLAKCPSKFEAAAADSSHPEKRKYR